MSFKYISDVPVHETVHFERHRWLRQFVEGRLGVTSDLNCQFQVVDLATCPGCDLGVASRDANVEVLSSFQSDELVQRRAEAEHTYEQEDHHCNYIDHG